jgi:hypothetical protein
MLFSEETLSIYNRKYVFIEEMEGGIGRIILERPVYKKPLMV